MGEIVEFGLNAAMVVLLSATVFYCWYLSRRIQILQDSKGELAGLLRQFDRSTTRATDAMDTLQHASKEAGKSVQGRLEKAQYMLDDLSYMIDRANKAAEQMEAGIAIARQREKLGQEAPAESAAPVATAKAAAPTRKPTSRPFTADPAESVGAIEATFERASITQVAARSKTVPTDTLVLSELGNKGADDLGEGISRASVLQSLRQAKAGGKGSSTAISSLQSLIEKVAERNSDEAQGDIQAMAMEPNQSNRLPSRGERELLKALEMQAE